MSVPDKIPQQPDEAHFQICQRAAEQLGRLVDGNGLKADQVRLARHETLVHQVPGLIHIELKPDIAKRTVKGNAPTGKVLADAEGVMREAAGLVQDVGRDPNVQIQIQQGISQDDGKGWAMEPFKIPLPAIARDFSVVQKCLKCNGQTYYTCERCHQTGMTPCPACQAQGYMQCQQCFGSGQFARGDGQRVPCNRCNAQGRMICPQCNAQRNIRCTYCSGRGRIDCTECDRSGFWTNIFQLSFHAEGEFILDRKATPENVLEVIDLLGVRNLATKGLAQIFRLGMESKEKFVTIPCIAFLPIAQCEFTVEGKPYPATVAGLPGRILTLQPLLDAAIKPGINALYKLGRGPMAAQALIDQACRYRIIRQVLGGVTKQSKKQVYQQLTKDYPVGLSEKYAKATIRYADQAISAMGKGPRLKGMLIGTSIATLIYALYFLGMRMTIRPAMMQSGHGRHLFVPDLAIWLLGYVVTLFVIRFMAGIAINKFLPDNVQNDKKGLPPAGEHAYFAIATSLAVWIGVALAGKAEWITRLFGMG